MTIFKRVKHLTLFRMRGEGGGGGGGGGDTKLPPPLAVFPL